MSHTKRCTNAKGERCRCICRGILHGGSRQQAPQEALVMEEVKMTDLAGWPISQEDLKVMRDYIQQIADVAEGEHEDHHLWRVVGYVEQFCKIHLGEEVREKELVAAQ